MHFIKTIPKEDADGKLKDVYANLEGMFGMIPSIFQSQSLMPDVLESVALFIRKMLMQRHKLTRFQKELLLSGRVSRLIITV